MKSGYFLLGVVIGFLLLPAVLYVYVSVGRVPVSSFDPEMPFETAIAGKALRARISREMPREIPISATEANFLAGAHVYRADCAMCHGLPGENPPVITTGMYPPPPQLFHGKGVTEDPVGETYWKVANGLRLTGMPGFRETLSPDKMWQVSLLVSQAEKLPADALKVLTANDASKRAP